MAKKCGIKDCSNKAKYLFEWYVTIGKIEMVDQEINSCETHLTESLAYKPGKKPDALLDLENYQFQPNYLNQLLAKNDGLEQKTLKAQAV